MLPTIDRSIARSAGLSDSAIAEFSLGMQKMPGVLAQLGFKELRPGQKDVVKTVMLGYDCVGILPTAAGKTATYVIPALCMGWRTIIISPLLALMADQEAAMQRMGVKAARLTSDVSPAQAQSVLNDWACGNLQIMLVSPERVSNPAWRSVVMQFPPDFVAMDECFVGDVELLTEDGFVRFDQLKDGTRCAQVDPDTQELSYVLPSKFIRRHYAGDMVRIRSEKGVDLEVTPGHDLLRYRKDGSWNKVQAGKAKFNHSWRFLGAPTQKVGRDELTPEERLQVAYQADGNRHSKTFAAFSFSKERKIIRFLKLMEAGGFEWTESKDNDPRNRRRFLVRRTAHLSKTMRGSIDLRALSSKGCRALVDEAIAWDGSEISDGLGYFSCTVESNTDFFQEACVLAGLRSRKTKQVDDRKASYKDVHRLFIRLGEPWIDTQNFTSETTPFSGKVYCVEVPTGCIVVRRAGKPVVIGNCHTFSQWADTFRSGYKFAGDFIREVNPKVVLALTATCPPEMEAEIRAGLSIQGARRVFYYPTRDNLKLHTLDLKSPTAFAPWVANNCPGSTIVYCATRKNVEEMCADIQRYVRDREVVFYHGGITSPAVKKDAQDRWQYSDDTIMVATNAFGMGIDKALPLDTLVLTPAGWVRNGDLVVGDSVVGSTGKATVVTHIHDRGVVAACDVTFDDGTIIPCSLDHVWAVRTPKEKYRGNGFASKRTADLKDCLRDNAGNNLQFVPVVGPVEFDGNEALPLAPYLLGLLLGDGGTSSGHAVRFHKDDSFLHDRILELMPAGGELVKYESCNYGLVYKDARKNPVLEALRFLKLAGLSAADKFVPDDFLWTSAANRLALLRGLMDTDGGVSGGGGVGAVFCTASPKLRDAVTFLARSLGGVPSWRKLANGDYWQVYLMLPNSVNPFLTPVKASLLKRRTKYEPTRCIVKIEDTAPTHMRCITVAAEDGLYVTEGFVVTHNSNVRSVVHYDLPGTLSALIQEAGRAGRDGEISHCWAYYNQKAISTQRYFIRIGNPTEDDIRSVLEQFRKMEDTDGTIHANRILVAQKADVDAAMMGAIMTFMYGERLVEEVKDSSKPARLRWAEAIPSFTPAEAQTRDAIHMVSRESGGWLEFDIEQLSQELNLKPATVGSRLTSMSAKGLFTYVRQDSRKPIRIIGNPDHVDFSRINKKAAEAREKLDEVIAYCDVPDEDKHAYLGRTMKTNEPPPVA